MPVEDPREKPGRAPQTPVKAKPAPAPVSERNARMQPRAEPEPREQPGRSPEGAAPLSPPHPVLQAAGFTGPVQDFNHRVERIVPAYQQAHMGQVPSPGLVLDIARSPVDPGQYDKLFEPSFLDPGSARLSGAISKQAIPATVRENGIVVQHTPLSGMLQSLQGHVEPVQETPKQLADAHPWVPVEAGFLPISNFDGLLSAFKALLAAGVTEDQGNLLVGGKSLSEYRREIGVASQTAQNTGQAINPEDLHRMAMPIAASTTVRKAQDELQARFPAYFKDLPASGNFNDDWVRAVKRFQGSSTYYQAATKQLASDNHFSNPAEFVKAWRRKQDAVNGSAWTATAAEKTPLAFYGNGQSVADFVTGGKPKTFGYWNVPTLTLHTIGGTARTVFAAAGILSATAKSDLAAAGMFYEAVTPKYMGGKGEGLREARDHAAHVARQNPSWLRALYPDLPDEKDEPAWLKVTDQVSNFAGDLILGNKLMVGGSAVKLGDTAALQSNRFYRGTTKLAYNSLRKRGPDGVGEASWALQGGERFNLSVAEKVRNGDLSLAQYRHHVSDLFHHGRTSVDGEIIDTFGRESDTVLSTLREKNLPNPSLVHQRIKKGLDEYEQTLRKSGFTGTDNVAGMFSSLRQLVARTAPNRARIYDPKAPQDLYNWVVTHLHDRDLAYKAQNDLVVLRAKDDIPGIQKLREGLNERYAAANPNRKGVAVPLESEGPQLESESLAYLNMLSGRQPNPVTALDRLEQAARTVNQRFNSVAAEHRQIIIGLPLTGESLFWKHLSADTARRFAGGGGLKFGLNKAQKTAKKDLEGFFQGEPEALREFSLVRAQTEMGEKQWIARTRPEDVASFNTGEHLDDPRRMAGAGAYLRGMLTDNALNAFRVSARDNLEPLFRHVWHSRFYQNKIAADPRYIEQAMGLKGTLNGEALRTGLSDLKKTFAQEWAETLWRRYQAIEQAGAKAGQPDTLEHLQQVLIEHPGVNADKALGKTVKDLQLDFAVKDAPVSAKPLTAGQMFDDASQRWIGRLMTFNKFNRREFFDHVFYNTYGELVKAGWARSDAVAASTALAKSQTVYHMLDFSNMLQVEQNLRWVSYFATKHRLYWTWIGRQFAHKPLLAAAVQDVGDHLDRGNLDLKLFGMRLKVPVARLFWVNQTEYPETSPLVEAAARAPKDLAQGGLGGLLTDFAQQTTTQGNVISREDQAVADLVKYVRASVSNVGYGTAVAGMSPIQKTAFNRELHNYALSYRASHNGRYPSEQDAVKATLLRAFAEEAWRANLFLPVLPDSGQSPEIVKLHQTFDLIQDPVKRRAFLDKHPQLADSFGASGDQQVWLHSQPLWEQFNKATQTRNARLELVRERIDLEGYNVRLAREIRQVSSDYRKQLDGIRAQDALTWPGNPTYPKGLVADTGEIKQQGPWGLQLDGDPLAAHAFLHEAFPQISKKNLDAHTVTQQVLDWRQEANRIRDLGWRKTGFPDDQSARDWLRNVERKISVFQALPKNPTSQMVDAYYTRFVDPYIKLRDKLTAMRGNASAADKDTVNATARAIQAKYDHTVSVVDPKTGKRVEFPSPVSFGFTMLSPDEYRSALAQAISGQWEHLANYEKNLLGIKTPNSVAEGWQAYQQTVSDYEKGPNNPPLAKEQRVGLAKQVDKVYPGFFKDFVFSQQPKIRRFEVTSVYQSMPSSLKTGFTQYLGAPARQVASAIVANGNQNYYLRWWRNYVRDQVQPWLQDPAQKQLRTELARYGPNFLNTLPSAQ